MARRYVSNAAPQNAEEMAEALYDGTHGVTPEAQRQFRDRYIAKMTEDGSLNRQIAEQTQMALAEFLKDNRRGGAPVDVGAMARSARSAAMYNRHAPGAAVDEVFSSPAEMFQSVSWRASHNPAAQRRLSRAEEIQNSFGSEVPDAGGFLVPETMRSEILMVALENAIVRRGATVIPMNTLRVPLPTIDDTSHVTNVFGGVQYYWTEEAAALTESQATFGRVVLDAKKLSGYFAVPNELLQDAPAFAGFFQTVVPKGMAWAEDVAFLNGTGASEPQGMVSCPAAVTVTAESGQATKTILWENIVKMYSRMLPTSLRTAVWICNNDTFPELATMALSVGTGGGPVWIGGAYGNTSGSDTPPMTLLGRPVIFTEKVPTLGTTGDIIFTDLSFYLVGERMQMELSSSEHYLFANDKTAFRLLERVDGRPWLQSAITPHSNSTNTLSAFVQLASR